MVELFAKIVNVVYLLTKFAKNSIIDVELGSKYTSDKYSQYTFYC